MDESGDLKKMGVQYHAIMQTTPDGFFVSAITGMLLEVNDKYCDMTGYCRDELLAMHISDLEDVESREQTEAHMLRVIEIGSDRFETRHRHRDGYAIDLEISVSYVDIDGGAMIVYARDISGRKRAEAELNEMRQRHEEAQRIARLGHWSLDLIENRLDWSDEVFRLFEVDKEMTDASFEGFVQAIHPDDRERVLTAYEQSLQSRSRYNIKHRLLMADGRIKWVHERCETSYNEEGAALRSIGTVQDITAHKHAEEALLRQAMLRDQLLDQASEGIVVWQGAEHSAEFVTWNRRMEEITGYSREEINSLGWLETVYDNEAERQRARSAMNRVLSGHRNVGVDFDIVTKSGEHRTIRLSSSAVEGEGGCPSVLGVIQDISDSIRQQRLLDDERKRFRELFESSGDGMFILDMKGNFIDVNQTAHNRLGYSKAELIAMHLTELDPPEFSAKVPGRMRQIRANGAATFETAHYRKDGTVMPVEVNARVMELGGREIVFSVIRDISERKQFEEQLRQSQKMEAIGTLVGGIAHDFNNMLAAMQGNLYLARRQTDQLPALDEKLNNIEQLSHRAADMVQQLLTFARKDSIQIETFDVTQFLAESIRLARPAVPENISLKVHMGRYPMHIRGNRTQLQQVLMNLLNNAVDALGKQSDPQIECRLSLFITNKAFKLRYPELHDGNFARISISDNGEGISDAILLHIFEPFFTTKEVGKGTGLGLAMAYGAIQSLGGMIEVESKVALGSHFHIYLPLSEEMELSAARRCELAYSHGETILLVDDNDEVRQTLAEVLESLGYHVIQSFDGEDALVRMREYGGQVDLLISDVVMPRMGGVALLHAARAILPSLPVLLATGYDRHQVLDTDEIIEDFVLINKPFQFDELAHTIRQQLSLRGDIQARSGYSFVDF